MRYSVAALAAFGARQAFAKPLPSGSVVASATPGIATSVAALVPASSPAVVQPVEAAVVQSSPPAAVIQASSVTTETTYTTAGHTFVVVEQPSNAVLVEEVSTTITLSEGFKTTFQDRRVSIDSTGSLKILSSSAVVLQSSAAALDVQQKAVVNPASGSGVAAVSSATPASGVASVVAAASSALAIDVEQKAVVNAVSGSVVPAASGIAPASGAASVVAGTSSTTALDVQQKAVIGAPSESSVPVASGAASLVAETSSGTAAILPSGSAVPQQKAVAGPSASGSVPLANGAASVSAAPVGASSGAALLVVDGDITLSLNQKAAVATAGGVVATQCKLITEPLSTFTHSYITGTDVNAPLATSLITFTEQLACTCSGKSISVSTRGSRMLTFRRRSHCWRQHKGRQSRQVKHFLCDRGSDAFCRCDGHPYWHSGGCQQRGMGMFPAPTPL